MKQTAFISYDLFHQDSGNGLVPYHCIFSFAVKQ